ncbi:hypothetical protein LPJ78_000394 [Coemansia sp. RSA 989]|nr:WD40-repeat-containing domain protein [Coemansia mojavensis]KAJ1744312.1 hypothetical protein LPJ68_000208 [Coemansia sp. RSA 1086]KAJ1753292.1 hypothetical protein LPJ79_000571 [Coemansia sp. RSA 1821]KAJ1868094.1 hypothetical protein LPJ78_000394 [Coemansia sp. RSA 989]KAJ1875029.1 hypothetical protein LPJ55_000967 [Coemansia sp. RSA 990]KAJ2676331.1 hypothetical protein IWW42_000620 [Coemansia sp. RSA 1085]
MKIESTDIIRLIEQFLKENNLTATLETLQKETGVFLNTVDDLDSFKASIQKGEWDVVLASAEQAQIAPNKRIDLYEQIIIELVEQQDVNPARALLRQTEPMEIMRTQQPDRYLHLERLMSRTTFDASFAYKSGETRDSRRTSIAEQLLNEVDEAPASRLLTLLGYSMKWQLQQSMLANSDSYNLFFGKATTLSTVKEDKVPQRLLATVKFPKKQHPTSLAFSFDGVYLATGSMDGFIEIWNYMTGKLATELKYQADGSLMLMEEAVTGLAFSHNSDFVCSGALDGKIKIWKIKTGTCFKRFSAAHSDNITCVEFSPDDSQVLSGGADHMVRIHGLKSGKMLKEFRGHSAPITSAVFSEDGSRVISASDDGYVRIWDTESATCLHSVVPDIQNHGLTFPGTHSLLVIPGSSNFVVCTKSPSIYLMSVDGKVLKCFTASQSTCNAFQTAALLPHGKYMLAVSDQSILHYVDFETNTMHAENKIPNDDVTGMACHPKLNIAAFISNDRRIPIWTA